MRDVNKPEHLDGYYRSVTLHTSLAHIHHQLVPPPGERNITEAILFRFSTAKQLLFLAFILSSFFLLDFDTLVLEAIEWVALYFF